MSYTLDLGFTSNAEEALSVSVPKLNYLRDFRTIKDQPGEVVLTNTTSPLDRGERIRYALTSVTDIYKNTGVEPPYRAPSKTGLSLCVQVSDVFRYEDKSDPSLPKIDLPVTAHLVLKAPKTSLITADQYLAAALRAVSLLFDGNNTSTHLAELLRGALDPNNK